MCYEKNEPKSNCNEGREQLFSCLKGIQKTIIIVFVPHAPAAAAANIAAAAALPHRLLRLQLLGSNERHAHAMWTHVLSGGLLQKICTPAFAC